MEVVGVIASSITLLEVSLKTLGFFQELSSAQDDFRSLRETVLDIEVALQDFQSIPRLFPDGSGLPQLSEPRLVARAVSQLGRIKTEIDEMVKYCAKRPGRGGTSDANKLRWVMKKGRIARLLEAARDARSSLHTGLHMQNVTLQAVRMVQERQSSSETRALVQLFRQVQQTNDGDFESSLRVTVAEAVEVPRGRAVEDNQQPENREGPEGEAVVETGEAVDFDEENPRTMSTSNKDVAVLADDVDAGPPASTKTQLAVHPPQTNPVIYEPIQRGLVQRRRCQCQTRRRWNTYQGPSWLEPILGSWIVERSSPRDESTAPEAPGCDCGGVTASSWKVEARLPVWLAARAMLLKVAHDGAGLNLTLRPARPIHHRDRFEWLSGRTGPEFTDNSNWEYFPEDYYVGGRVLMEIALSYGSFTAVEFMLQKWVNILTPQSFPREVEYIAYQRLKYYDCSEKEASLLHRILSHVDDAEGYEVTSSVHAAAKLGQGVQEALEQEPWTLHQLDSTGYTPLDLAAIHGNREAMRTLIEAGADVDQKGYGGCTALSLAAYNGRTDCVRLLLEQGCRVDLEDKAGSTALHYAAMICKPDIISVLLAKGASASAHNAMGLSALHVLGKIATNQGDVEQSLRLLVASGQLDCDYLAEGGGTPLMYAIFSNKIMVLGCLVAAGASLKQLDNFGCNILHYAGTYAQVETLQYLVGIDPVLYQGIDPRRRVRSMHTTWDCLLDSLNPRALNYRKHSQQECKHLFARLLQMVQDENIRHEVNVLTCTVEHLRRGRIDEARGQLALLIAQRKEWQVHGTAGYYRGIDQQVQAGELEAVMRGLEEDIEDLNGQVGKELWRESSRADVDDVDDVDDDFETTTPVASIEGAKIG